MLPTMLGRATFRLEHWNCGTQLPNPKAENHPAKGKLDDAVRRGLQQLADNDDDGSQEDCLAPAKPVTKGNAREGAHERPKLQRRDDCPLFGRVFGLEFATGVDRVDFGEYMYPSFVSL
jgi:hypothetical protein